MKVPKHFASDNFAGVHADIMKALSNANSGHHIAYGEDLFTRAAVKTFQEHFGENIEIYFVFGGTGANVLGLEALTESYHAVICADTAHINVDECGAVEKFTGCKLLPVASPDGKIRPQQLFPYLHAQGVEHHSQPKVISITQATEYGTLYTPEEIEALAKFAHDHDMLLHMDGARIANAAAALDLNFSDITGDVGVDALSFGGTKNGLMFGEAVVFFTRSFSKDRFKYVRKHGMQLYSKMRFISAQFQTYLSDDLWLRNAKHANEMAQILAQELEKIPNVNLTQTVEANAVFAILPQEAIPAIQEKYFFYIWNEETSEVRLMTSFDTTKKDIKNFIKVVEDALPS